ncbi:MAG: fumarylacetoacetate hydrolase family protein [bacterium]
MKNPATMAHPDDPVVIPASCMDPLQVDYEVEVAVVIGKAAQNVSIHTALQYVLGYTIANDISARRWQALAGSGQWVRGKSFDTFCPLGPILVTPDEIPDPQFLQLKCSLNGNTMQDAHTSEYRNAKQIQISNSLMTKTKSYPPCQIRLLFGSFEFRSLNIVSYFGFRASNFVSIHFGRADDL